MSMELGLRAGPSYGQPGASPVLLALSAQRVRVRAVMGEGKLGDPGG